MIDILRKEILDTTNATIFVDEPMKKHTTYGIGGPAELFVLPSNKQDLIDIVRLSKEHKQPVTIIGSGSNLLISDSGIKGVVVSIKYCLRKIDIDVDKVYVECGIMLGKMVKECIRRHLSGVESMIGVPGTLGGALIMNAGAFGGEISNYLKHVIVMTMSGQVKVYKPEDLSFSYRHSTFPTDEIVISAEFELIQSDAKTVMRKRSVASGNRKASQPLKFRSAGSVFKNPPEGAAGYFIDQAGLKGTKIGDAEISPIHANFFVNKGNAKANDIVGLIRLTKKAVHKKFGIMLNLEVKTLGFKTGTFDL